MSPRALVGLALVVLVASAAPGAAQDVTAEVRTWGGQSWRLAHPSLEVFYTIVPKAREGAAAPLPPGATPVSPGGGSSMSPGAQPSGSMQTPSPLSERGPEPKQGHTQREVVTLHQEGVEIQIPLMSIASLVFFRRPIPNSPLPPYVAPIHFHYAATAVLVDGSRVEGDYVNLGTTLLRGMTPQGRVDIPWEDIEIVRFER